MEEDLLKLDALFDSIIDEITHPELAGTFKNPFLGHKAPEIAELAVAVVVIMVRISDDCMSAYATAMSKNAQHKPFTADDIMRVASTSGVFYGIDEEAVKNMAEQQIINTEVKIASGIPPVDGTDGRLSLKFDMAGKTQIPKIESGFELCHAVSPKSGRDGKDVRGRVLQAAVGKVAEFATGEGITKKGNRYYAEYSGTLVLRDGIYSIVDEMVLDKNVDQTSGIIGYAGTIIINGNVTGKAIVRAGRSIIVHGTLTSSVLEAEKDIIIDGRASDASVSAKDGSITGNEFFSSTLIAGEHITASVIDGCTVKCVNGIDCTGGYGRITGGQVFCAGDVNCMTIGSREHTETHITLGNSSEFTGEIRTLEKRVSKLDDEIGKITVQVNQIHEREKQGTATLEDQSFLDAAMRIRSQKMNEKVPLLDRIKKLSKIIENSDKATLHAKSMIYGGSFLTICGFTQILNADRSHATAYSNGSNIVIT